MIKALFTDCPLNDEEIIKLKKAGIEIIRTDVYLDEEDLIKKLKGCDVYIIGGADKATKRVIDSTSLKLIIFYGTGYENHIDTGYASEKKIPIANTPKANAYTVAEHCVALILDAVKQITYLNNETKNGKWIRRQAWNLEDKVLGIVGMGTIGGYVAKIMHNGFKMNIIYSNRGERRDLEKELKAKKVPLGKLMSEADVISINASYDAKNVGMVNKDNLKYVKNNAVLICTSRAELVDPKDLRYALKNGNLACAAFDSYYKEPVPKIKNDKWKLLAIPDNKFIITPHTAYGSREAIQGMNNMVVENLLSFVKNGIPKYIIK